MTVIHRQLQLTTRFIDEKKFISLFKDKSYWLTGQSLLQVRKHKLLKINLDSLKTLNNDSLTTKRFHTHWWQINLYQKFTDGKKSAFLPSNLSSQKIGKNSRNFYHDFLAWSFSMSFYHDLLAWFFIMIFYHDFLSCQKC